MTASEVDPRRASGSWALFALLVVLGAAHWAFVLGLPPRVPRAAADWPKEIRYYTVLQQAVSEGRVPYYISRPIQDTRKFLAIPELVLSPQVLLLRWVSVDQFLFAHVVLLTAVGTLGCLAIRRRYALSLPSFLLLWLLFSFNGHVTAHFAIGHSMWGGYYLLPFFFLLVLDLVETGPDARWPAAVGLVLGAMLLQGSFHVFVWCVFFLLLLSIVQPSRLAIAGALAWSAGLGLVRLVPGALIFLGRRDQPFETGYASVGDLLAGLVQVRDITFPRRGGGSMGGLNWWEFDAYVGVVGLVWMTIFGLRGVMRPPHRRLVGPMLAMTALSFGALYRPLYALGLPLLASQRVSSRFLIVPLGLLIVLAARASEEWLRPRRLSRRLTLWLAVGLTAALLLAHSRAWTTAQVEALTPAPPRHRDLSIAIVAPSADEPRNALYLASVRGSAIASAVTLVAAVAWLASKKSAPPQRTGADPSAT